MKNREDTPPKVGLLGGGQLAQMLAQAAQPLGLPVSVLTASKTDPAALVCGDTVLGSLEDEADLKKFLTSLDAVTFESEFINSAKLLACSPAGLHIFPNLNAVETIQDRLTQKQLLDRYKIPTSPWVGVAGREEFETARQKFSEGFVLKKRRFGYDGYGTYIFKNGQGDEKALNKGGHGFIAEKFVDFKKELAFGIARSRTHGSVILPLVESVQKHARCYSVVGPVKHPKLAALAKSISKMMTDLDYQGLLTIELFETVKGQLLVNELAPRVHNSGHYSQNALTCSQFEYHWRAGLDWPLPKVEVVRPGFAMVNLLGEGGNVSLSKKALGALHWYGKTENRPGRKLGHINVLGKNPKAALKAAEAWRKDFRL